MAKYLNLAGLQTLWTKAKNTFALKSHSHTAADIPVDSALSSTSENPVQNKVVNTALAGKSDTSHAHGLSNNSFYGTCTNSTTDDGWKMLDSNIDGKTSNYAALRAIRFNTHAPAWAVGRYGAGIFFGGGDTKGLISLTYPSNAINVKFAGGSGSKPSWWFGLSGSSGKNYTLENMRERYSIAYHRNSTDNKQWTKIAWHQESNYPTGNSWNNSTAVLNFYQNSYGGAHLANLGRLMLQSYWGHSKVAEGGTPYSFKTSGTKNAYWQHYVPSVCYVGDYTTYNSGRLNVKIVCSDDTIEWWVANCIWDMSLQFDVLYKDNINLSGNGTGSVIMTNDEFNEYCEDKLVRDVTLGDGTTASSAVTASNASNCNYSGKSDADTLVVKRTNAAGGAFVKYYPNNQTTVSWRVGSHQDGGQFIFQYKDATKAFIDANGAYNGDVKGNASTASAAKSGSALETAINGKADAASVTGATKCKVTYNNQGIVTAGADLAASDIPNLAASKITSGTFADDRIASASKWNGKQDALTSQTAYSSKGSETKVPKITTNTLGQVTNIEEVTITQPDISGKADDNNVVHKTNDENISGVKTLISSDDETCCLDLKNISNSDRANWMRAYQRGNETNITYFGHRNNGDDRDGGIFARRGDTYKWALRIDGLANVKLADKTSVDGNEFYVNGTGDAGVIVTGKSGTIWLDCNNNAKTSTNAKKGLWLPASGTGGDTWMCYGDKDNKCFFKGTSDLAVKANDSDRWCGYKLSLVYTSESNTICFF